MKTIEQMEPQMTGNVNNAKENLPYIWPKHYRNETASPETALAIAHERARGYLSRAIAAAPLPAANPPATRHAEA
jgi:hypothetical protein